MTRQFKSLGSALLEPDKWGDLKFPYLASYKIDGWRCFEYNGMAMARSLKPIKNKEVQGKLQAMFARAKELGVTGLDGELVVGPVNAPNLMQRCTSALSTADMTNVDMTFWVFDSYQNSSWSYLDRITTLNGVWPTLEAEFLWLRAVKQKLVSDIPQLEAFEEESLGLGFEGVMLRDPYGRYKMGHSTLRENIMLKVKKFVTAECRILSVKELMHNENEAVINELGHTERPGGKAGLVPGNMLGAVVCADDVNFPTVSFDIGGGPGLTHDLRIALWNIRDQLPGRLLTYKFFPVGVKDRPRFPKWVSLRDKDDLG